LGQARLLTTNRAAALVLTAGTRADCNTAAGEEMLRFRQLQVVVDRTAELRLSESHGTLDIRTSSYDDRIPRRMKERSRRRRSGPTRVRHRHGRFSCLELSPVTFLMPALSLHRVVVVVGGVYCTYWQSPATIASKISHRTAASLLPATPALSLSYDVPSTMLRVPPCVCLLLGWC
jgi:hypothetical protein